MNYRTISLIIFLAGVSAFAQEAENVNESVSLMGLISQGGWAMWPLGLCSFLLITIIALNIRIINQKKMMPPDEQQQLKAAAEEQDFGTLWHLSKDSDSMYAKGLSYGLRKMNPEDPAGSKLAIEEAIGESISRQESQQSFWINFLSLIAGVAPMIGLLGTVSGMIGAFKKIGQGGMGKPELLAANIGEALITTASGLVIAIPAMFCFFLFRNLLNRIMINMEESYSQVVEDLTGTGLEVVQD